MGNKIYYFVRRPNARFAKLGKIYKYKTAYTSYAEL